MRIGDVVRLRSGSPAMTVAGIEAGLVELRWFDDEGLLQSAAMEKAALCVTHAVVREPNYRRLSAGLTAFYNTLRADLVVAQARGRLAGLPPKEPDPSTRR